MEIEDALSVFDREGRTSLRRVVGTLGEALAGRGEDINETIGTTATMLPGLQRVLATLSARDTRLAEFVRGAAAATTALAPLSNELVLLIRNARSPSARWRRRVTRSAKHRTVPPDGRGQTGALRHAQPGAGRRRGDLTRPSAGGEGARPDLTGA